MVNELYQLIGEILENAQYIEWNIALSVCNFQKDNQKINVDSLFEKMQTSTMGKIIEYAKQTEIFDANALDELKYILNKRNYLAHQFFKKNDIVKHQNNCAFLQNKISELRNILTRFQEFNQWLAQKVL